MTKINVMTKKPTNQPTKNKIPHIGIYYTVKVAFQINEGKWIKQLQAL